MAWAWQTDSPAACRSYAAPGRPVAPGFSSFSYLKDLPVDNIKIDRSFVDKVTTNEKDAAVCKGVITLAREMGLNVVAEGVETQEQFSYLKGHGCVTFQGYYFARPMPFDDLVQWIGNAG